MTDSDYPWRDESRLYELYWEQELSTTEIEDEVGCAQQTVSKRVQRFDIPRRDAREAAPNRRRRPRVRRWSAVAVVGRKLEPQGGDGAWGTDQYGIHTAETARSDSSVGIVCVYHPQITKDSVLHGRDDLGDETEEQLNTALWRYGERVATLIEDGPDEFIRRTQDYPFVPVVHRPWTVPADRWRGDR